MPNSIIKSFSKKSGKSEDEIEKLWDELKDQYDDDYSRIVSTLKKILKINENLTFREYLKLNEDKSSNEFGLTASGQLMEVEIYMQKNNLMEISIKGKRTLGKLKSVERLKSEYSEEDWNFIEKKWKETSSKNSTKIEKLVQKFEDDLNKIVIDMQKEIEDI